MLIGEIITDMKKEKKGTLYVDHLIEEKNVELMMSATLEGGDGSSNFEELLAQLEMLNCCVHGHEKMRIDTIVASVESARDKLESMYQLRKIVPEKGCK